MAYLYNWLLSYTAAQKQIPSLVASTLDRLATQATLHDDKRVTEPYISVGQLRDDVLRNIFSKAERESVWERVRKIVEANSNVRASTREGGKTGEWSRVWEWIGPSNFAPGVEGRKSGGFLTDSPASAVSPDNTSIMSNVDDGNVSARRWNEGRPIY